MGGEPRHAYPKHVWSHSGGWWVNPPAWRRNTAFAGLAIAAVSALVFNYSSSIERRPVAPAWHIPSQKWCKHAKEDDPSLKKQGH